MMGRGKGESCKRFEINTFADNRLQRLVTMGGLFGVLKSDKNRVISWIILDMYLVINT